MRASPMRQIVATVAVLLLFSWFDALAVAAAVSLSPASATLGGAWGQIQGAPPLTASSVSTAATATGFPDPTIVASAGGPGSVTADLSYYFEIVGPSAVSIPIIIDANLSASIIYNSSGGTGANARFFIQGGGANFIYCVDSDNPNPYNCSGESEVLCSSCVVDLNLPPNIEILAESGVAAAALQGENAVAIVDPSIYINPIFSLADEYAVLLSPGIGNPPPGSVPEPTSLALLATSLLLGFVKIGSHAKSKSRQFKIIDAMIATATAARMMFAR